MHHGAIDIATYLVQLAPDADGLCIGAIDADATVGQHFGIAPVLAIEIDLQETALEPRITWQRLDGTHQFGDEPDCILARRIDGNGVAKDFLRIVASHFQAVIIDERLVKHTKCTRHGGTVVECTVLRTVGKESLETRETLSVRLVGTAQEVTVAAVEGHAELVERGVEVSSLETLSGIDLETIGKKEVLHGRLRTTALLLQSILAILLGIGLIKFIGFLIITVTLLGSCERSCLIHFAA